MLAEQVDYVVGVDTHRDEHALAVVEARTGAVIAQTTTATNARGYANAVRFADRYAPDGRLWAIRHRLSRGGDRQLNRALHTIVLHRRHTTKQHATTSPDASPKAKARVTPPASSSATSPATSTASCKTRSRR